MFVTASWMSSVYLFFSAVLDILQYLVFSFLSTANWWVVDKFEVIFEISIYGSGGSTNVGTCDKRFC
jgi:hypothetical protein